MPHVFIGGTNTLSMIIDCGIRYEAQGRYNKNSGHEILSEALWSHRVWQWHY